ncbi:MAG: TIGR01906 family membrane protein [Bulleidia sp.]
MRPIITKACSIIASLCFLITLLVTLIDCLCFNRGFFSYEYEKNGQAEVIGMSDADLMRATDTLLDYLKGKRDDIAVTAEINGVTSEVFTTRESMHMVDVRQLYRNALAVRNICAVVCVVLCIGLVCTVKDRRFSVFLDGFENGLFMMGCTVLCILLWAVLDFSDFWMDFHYLFFDNDLFLLDPSSSIMINMFPESFFFDMVLMIIVCFAVVCAMLFFGFRHMEKKESAL